MNRIVIDDLRTYVGEAYHARTSGVGVLMLAALHPRVDELWLDHDLGPDDDIMPVVDYLSKRAFETGKPLPIGTIYVHSQNPVGAANVMRALERWGYAPKRRGVESFMA